MVGIFKQKHPGNTLFLLAYALVLKFEMFLKPVAPVQNSGDHFLYTQVLHFLTSLNLGAVVYALLAFLLLFFQASLLNRICNGQKFFTKSNYLPAMAFMLITSLFPEWNQFSAPLLVNTLLIWILYKMFTLYNAQKASAIIFNIGMLTGIVTFLYYPAIVFIALIIFSLFIMRPFHIREWVIAFLGITTPYYFAGILLYLSGQWSWKHLLPSLSLSFPGMPISIFNTGSIVLLVLPFIIGGFYIQNNLGKMLIQVRKGWSLLLLFLIISLSVILIKSGGNYLSWVLCVVPLSVFHAAAYFYAPGKIFSSILHWLIFLYVIYITYVI